MAKMDDVTLRITTERRRDGDKLVAWLREGADELEKAHRTLDNYGVPRSRPGSDCECTLAARISLALEPPK